MLVAAAALAVLTPVLVTLGSMSWEAIAKGLVTVAGAFARHRNGRRTAHSAAADDSWPGRRLRSDRRWCCRRWGRSAPCRNRPIRHCGGHYGPGNLPWSGRSHYRGRPDLYHHGHRGADPGHCGEAGWRRWWPLHRSLRMALLPLARPSRPLSSPWWTFWWSVSRPSPRALWSWLPGCWTPWWPIRPRSWTPSCSS